MWTTFILSCGTRALFWLLQVSLCDLRGPYLNSYCQGKRSWSEERWCTRTLGMGDWALCTSLKAPFSPDQVSF
ncbi:hypothetical protein HOLleu_02877 [Holothuria leucospilota]|uniref:Secreted protein n=1 Tax=Holothuria leucospilota TaxID=206669 RepID=A0A9Q1CS71_HOLLE|nr:hypothetical protein HOLleu_02877 [Holothuria leucospilota]